MKLLSCAACDRPFARHRLVTYTLWHEEVCRACYKWACEVVYGDMTNPEQHTISTPWPHGIFMEDPNAS